MRWPMVVAEEEKIHCWRWMPPWWPWRMAYRPEPCPRIDELCFLLEHETDGGVEIVESLQARGSGGRSTC